MDDAGLERLSYDSWGMRRDATDWVGAPASAPSEPRGYTGHEHLDDVNLIHMNGRLYDPQLGRMVSADPFLQDPLNSQSFNRYAYVWNNPLKYTDPSGFFSAGTGTLTCPSAGPAYCGGGLGDGQALDCTFAADAVQCMMEYYGPAECWFGGMGCNYGDSQYYDPGSSGSGSGSGSGGGSGAGEEQTDASKSQESEESQTVVEDDDDSDKNRGKKDIRTTVENGSPQNHKIPPVMARNGGALQVQSTDMGIYILRNLPEDPKAIYLEGRDLARQQSNLGVDDSVVYRQQFATCPDPCMESALRHHASSNEAIDFLMSNPNHDLLLGRYDSKNDKSVIYHTATVESQVAYPDGSIESIEFKAGLGGGSFTVYGVESVLSVIAHETGHRERMDHGDLLNVRIYSAVMEARK